MNSISKITDMLLKKYNEKYEAFEKNNVDDKIDNINPRDILDFKKIILDLKDTNKTAKTLRNEDIKEIDCHDTKITNLTEMDFVQDLTLTEKIVIFRKLEIKKQIMIINYLIQSFKVVSYQLIKYEEKNSARLGEEQIRREHDILIKNNIPLLSDSKIYMESPYNVILGNPHNVSIPYIGDETGKHLAIQHYLSGHMEKLSHYHNLF